MPEVCHGESKNRLVKMRRRRERPRPRFRRLGHKGTRVQADAIVENARAGCTAEEIAGPDIFPSIPLDIVQRVLCFAKITPPSNG